MADIEKIQFTDNPTTHSSTRQFTEIMIDVPKALESWRNSIFSFEWVLSDGKIKEAEELCERERPKRMAVEERLKNGLPLEKPVLGIGLEDNIEIGSGRAEFLTLAALGVKKIPVHIPQSNEKDFKLFRADVS